MLVYNLKLLELIGIEFKSEKHYLHIMFFFEEEVELFWEIDEFTANCLTPFIQLDNNYKYRLSLNHTFDKLQNHHLGILTKTYLESSDKISFLCSEDFINALNTIKNIQNTADLDKLDFISRTLEENTEESKVEEIHEIIEVPEKSKKKFTYPLIFASSIILIILFSYFNQDHINKARSNEEVLAQSTNSDITMDLSQEETPNNTIDYLEEEDLLLDEPLIEEITKATLPSVILDNGESIYKIPEGKVALTFDDGPSKYSIDIMDVLNKYEVGATFFFTGSNAEKYPDYIRTIKSNGYSIGSHSMNHFDMKTISYKKQEYEITQSIKLLEDIVETEINLFRPPYGSVNKQIRDLVSENQYKLVLWNNDPEDWKTNDVDQIFTNIQNSNVSGSIMLLHESQAVIDALPRIIEYLQELNLEIVNLE